MAAIVEDTRQQAAKHQHIEKWMAGHGVQFEPRARALPFGDYMTETSNVVVDTKKDVQELVMNVGKDHKRFVRELERARVAGCRLVILVEEHASYNTKTNIRNWVSTVCRRCRRCNPRTSDGCSRYRFKPMQGEALYKTLVTLENKYGVRFEFCRKADTARRICELLGVEHE